MYSHLAPPPTRDPGKCKMLRPVEANEGTLVMRILILLTSTIFFAAAPAAATITNIVGGPGGQPFELRCPKDTIAVGLSANTGAWVDGLALLCSSNRRGLHRPTDYVGSTHSSRQEVYCPRGQAVTSLQTNFTNGHGLEREYLNGVAIRCAGEKWSRGCIDTGEGCSIILAEYLADRDRLSDDSFYCPEDEVLVGLVGKAGKSVDAIGAICGPTPGLVRLGSSAAGERATEPSPYGEAGNTSVSDELKARAPVNAIPPSSFGSGPRSTQAIPSNAAPSILPPMGQCRSGYVWREAGPGDLICVTPAGRERARLENDLAASRIDPNSAYGPKGCQSGFVWREAFPGDLVCVSPGSRSAAAQENAAHDQRRH